MKKILSVFTVLFLFSCSSDDNGGSIDMQEILGRWHIYSIAENGGEEELFNHEPQCDKDFLDFKNTGVMERVSYFYYESIDVCEENYLSSGVYTVSGNKINISFESGSGYVWEVKTLTDNLLVVEQIDGGGVLEMKFTRE